MLLYILQIIKTKLISRYYNNLLFGHFSIGKVHKLITQKYY